MVALVQSASTLPVFLLGVPSGALADILDRRRYLIATQCWIATVGVVLCLTKFAGTLERAPVAGAHVCKWHRVGDALAGLRSAGPEPGSRVRSWPPRSP